IRLLARRPAAPRRSPGLAALDPVLRHGRDLRDDPAGHQRRLHPADPRRVPRDHRRAEGGQLRRRRRPSRRRDPHLRRRRRLGPPRLQPRAALPARAAPRADARGPRRIHARIVAQALAVQDGRDAARRRVQEQAVREPRAGVRHRAVDGAGRGDGRGRRDPPARRRRDAPGTRTRGDAGMSRLYLIDGTALAYRSYFAFAGSSRGGLTTRSGRPTAAIYGFTMALRALLDREKPERIVVSFDGPRKDLARTRIYADYKSTRDKIPDE